jgi:sulfur-oxidizing protein SoxY
MNELQAEGLSRRRAIGGVVAWLGSVSVIRPASATTEELNAAIAAFAGGVPVREGRVEFDIAPLVENGNTVPVTVRVQSPMSEADHVQAIAIFNEKNPQRDVAVFHLGPRAGRATIATRIRLATSQKLVAIARMNDGSCWSCSVDVIVTLAACVES